MFNPITVLILTVAASIIGVLKATSIPTPENEDTAILSGEDSGCCGMRMVFGLTVGIVFLVAGCSSLSSKPRTETPNILVVPSSAAQSLPSSSPSEPSTWAPVLDYEGIDNADSLVEAYEEGYQGVCDEIWSNSQDGVLYYDDEGYTQDDCQSEMDSGRAYDALDADEALDMGREDAIESTFNLSPIEHLCWGTECWGPEDY